MQKPKWIFKQMWRGTNIHHIFMVLAGSKMLSRPAKGYLMFADNAGVAVAGLPRLCNLWFISVQSLIHFRATA
jgi:hypothetical protein